MVADRKYFGIGLNKTGTTTLNYCFREFGLGPVLTRQETRVTTAVRQLLINNDSQPAIRLAGDYRSFEDRPWNIGHLYQQLDMQFHDSRFILTVRDPENWWRSVEHWLTYVKPWMLEVYCRHMKVYPTMRKAQFLLSRHTRYEPLGWRQKKVARLKQKMLIEYERYNQEVVDYFSLRDNFLAINFEETPGWDPLCRFLELPQPDSPFPHANRQDYEKHGRA